MESLLNSRKKYNAQHIVNAYVILTKPTSLCSIDIITVPNFLDYYGGGSGGNDNAHDALDYPNQPKESKNFLQGFQHLLPSQQRTQEREKYGVAIKH